MPTMPCRLSKAPHGTQIEAPLPADRVTLCIPFSTTGIGFAGPLYVRNSKLLDTAYIALFVGSTTRALHIELVSDLTTDKFLMALQSFVGRRGLPHTISTDNTTTFHAINRELSSLWNSSTSTKVQQFYAINGIRRTGALVGAINRLDKAMPQKIAWPSPPRRRGS
ncbi:hypothetical protein AVEN_144058-1 [Araneus ventricosus]|uniref:Integrase catalytic domain-containing protein n=1 Tax=Araneus ventricosus TaxID=182803 RepID=A0A4Y2DEQ0_ARAVE|nr:hypothetical protein AVEN_144058-1 [Araneus ventricosus]